MENRSATLDLVEFLDLAGPKAIADLSRLRAQLIEDELVKAGVQAERIGRATRETGDVAGLPQESQRIDLVVKLADPAAT
jgi:hypothetical protein